MIQVCDALFTPIACGNMRRLLFFIRVFFHDHETVTYIKEILEKRRPRL